MSRLGGGFFLAAALAGAPAARAQHVQPPILSYSGDWLETPSLAEIEAVKPAGVTSRAYVVLGCSLSLEGRPTGCAVVSEDPRGSGVGAAALALAPRFLAARPDPGRSPTFVRIVLAWPGEGGSCQPPYCTPTPAPPPPPAAR